ncbi:hypothetical protein Pmani_009224 [Petrolisthes manimaculis]|uniref:Uncharacterized protein n=1 Tax=Petrolisthes manimaculis TaxID=1843537 RepID=A0AAE1UIL6_9EUCA|nr:hypothetical protein Pmani_009224 [Petrolisthes manimaculis]
MSDQVRCLACDNVVADHHQAIDCDSCGNIEGVKLCKHTGKANVYESANNLVSSINDQLSDPSQPEASRPNHNTLIRIVNRARASCRPKDPSDLSFEVGVIGPVREFMDYVDQTWLQSPVWKTENWSVFGRSIRTNNDVEGWHHKLNRRAKKDIGKKEPMVYTPAEEAMLALLESEAWGLKELPDSQEEISEAAPSVSMVATSAPVASISAAAAVPSTSKAEYIDKTGESHIVDVLISIDVPDVEEELAVEHSYSAQSPAFKSFTQPRSRPASRPASCPDGRPASCPASRPASCPAGRPASCPAGRPASCPAGRPASRSGFATRRSAASGNEQELVANMLQVQKTISDNVEKMENHLEVIASSVVSIAASMQEIASAVKTVSN